MSIEDQNTETTIDVTTTDNLDDFASTFFGENEGSPSENANSEDEPEDSEDTDNGAPTETDTQEDSAEDGGEDDEASDDDDDSDETDTTENDDGKPKKKVNRYQERINEIVAKQRQAERERDEALRKLEEATKPSKPDPEKGNRENTDTSTAKGPAPDDKNEDGTDKYPLGEFDPNFVKDTVQHMLDEELKARQEKEAQNQKLTEEQQYRANLQDTWNTKLVDAQERYPDFQEKGEQMLTVFEGIDDAYGQYLTDTLMEMDAGPEVFYYLANNLDEAQNIVNAGPRKATIALAKLEAQLAGTPVNKAPAKKVTKAPTPPPQLKGSAAAKPSVSLDTDDLDAFSKVLFKKK